MTSVDQPLVGLDDIRAAAARLAGIAIRTPLLRFGQLASGMPVLLKAESLQPVGAFKIRGAYNMMAQLSPAERASHKFLLAAMARAEARAERAPDVRAKSPAPRRSQPTVW